MINLGWNTKGRIGLADYRKARWRHIAFCIIPFVLFVMSAPAAAIHLYLSIAVAGLGVVLLAYYRYRFLQVMVRRLHDRNMSGKVLILSPILMIVTVIVMIGIAIAAVAGDAAVPHWLNEHMQAVIWATIIPIVAFGGFIGFQMARPGTPGVNRYGPPTDVVQAQIF